MTHKIRGMRDVEERAYYVKNFIMSTKRWFGKKNVTSSCDVTNSAHQIQMMYH